VGLTIAGAEALIARLYVARILPGRRCMARWKRAADQSGVADGFAVDRGHGGSRIDVRRTGPADERLDAAPRVVGQPGVSPLGVVPPAGDAASWVPWVASALLSGAVLFLAYVLVLRFELSVLRWWWAQCRS